MSSSDSAMQDAAFRFARAWRDYFAAPAGRERPRLEDALADVAPRIAPDELPVLFEMLLREEVRQRGKNREQVDPAEYEARFANVPHVCDVIHRIVSRTGASDADPSASPPRFLASPQLVFGIIALQNSFITREQLVAAFDAWVQDKACTLAEILVSQGALTQTHHDLLERLVAMFLEKHHGDADQSLAALSSVAEVRPDLERLQDADLAASLGHVSRGRPSEQDLASTLIRTTDGSRGRFRILRPHAKGGLGQVSVALDQELNREVALKEIQPRHADDRASRERFVLEAEITGGLEHPGIVPVYALGQAPDGRPFYAMRFVKGDSLKTAIESYHQPDNPNRHDLGARQLELRRLLGRFIDVCNAIDYAHSRGVLHRDLKPGNIMVGKYGETLVVDWGLAKAVGRKEVISDEASLRPATPLSSSGQTQPGSAVGTPAYMSPEQAAGDLDRLGPSSDVYSLGATLYHVLTGQPPFEKGNLTDILAKVERGDFPRPRSRAADVPPPLEAICLKAMSLKPNDRYLTARALADDLEQWLADEPVTAHADSISARVARWSRKHRGWIQAGSVAVILISIVSILSAYLVNEQRLVANERATRLKRAVARSHFDQGLRDYADGQLTSSFARLTQSVRMSSVHAPHFTAYRQVFADRCLQGGHQLTPPMRHDSSVIYVAFASDGSRVVTGSKDQTVRLWNAETGEPLGEPMSHQGMNSVALSADGSRVATAGWDGTARLWDGRTGQVLGIFLKYTPPPGPRTQGEEWIRSVAFSPDCMQVATGKHDGTVQLWDSKSGKAVGKPMSFEHSVTLLTYNSDGSRLLTACEHTSTARLWDPRSNQPLGNLLQHESSIECAAFSPDGNRVVTGSLDNTAQLWNASTAERLGEPMRHESAIYCVAFSPDGNRVVTGSADGTAVLWDAFQGRRLGEPMRHLRKIECVAFSPDGTRVATGSGDRTARIWDGKTGHPHGEPMMHDKGCLTIAFSPDGMRVVTGSADNTARLWDANFGSPVGGPIGRGLALSTDGTRVVTVTAKNTFRLCDTLSGQLFGDAMSQDEFTSAKFSPAGTRLVTVGIGSTQLWDANTGKRIGDPIKHRGPFLDVMFSKDGTRFVIWNRHDEKNGIARLWDAIAGQPVGEPIRHEREIACLAFSQDSTRLVTGSRDGIVRQWAARTGLPVGEMMRYEGAIRAFSPDGTRVVTLLGDNAAQLWDASAARPLGTPMRLEEWIANVAFSPDGTRVALVSHDMTLQLWDATTGQPVGEALTQDEFVAPGARLLARRPSLEPGITVSPQTSIAFSPDCTRVVSWSNGSTAARLWDATSGHPLGQPMRHDGPVWSAAIDDRGKRILTADWKGAHLWDAMVGQPLGYSIRHGEGIPSVAFVRGGMRIITQSPTLLWDVAMPELEGASAPSLFQSFELWSGVRSDEEGTVKVLDGVELTRIRRSLRDQDPMLRCQRDRYARNMPAHHRHAAANAESTENWFAAAFHLQRLLELQPGDADLKRRLNHAAGMLKSKAPLSSVEAAAP